MRRGGIATAMLLLAARAWGASDQKPALPADYESRIAELERARRDHPQDVQLLENLAGSYAMGARYREAIEVVQALRAMQPDDPAPVLRLARLHAWSGMRRAAIRYYEEYLKQAPGDRRAGVELIRQLRYRGEYEQAEEFCNSLLTSQPDDAEVLALKAEVLHWAGDRRWAARASAERARALAPESPEARLAHAFALHGLGLRHDARCELDALRDELPQRGGAAAESSFADGYRLLERELDESSRLQTQIPYSVYNDSDSIRDVSRGVRLTIPVRGDHSVELGASESTSSAPLGGIFTAGRNRASVREFAAGGRIRPAAGWALTILAGGSALSGAGRLRPTFDLQAEVAPWDRWAFTFGASRAFLKVTPRAMDLEISSYRGGAGVKYAFDSRTSISVQADRRWWSDANHSTAGEAVLKRVLHRASNFGLHGGLLTRAEGFARDTQLAAGFFTPDLYLRHEGFLYAHFDAKRRVVWEVRGAGGAQRILQAAPYQPSWEMTTWLSIRLAGAVRLSGSYQRRNYSLLARDGWYHGFYFSLGLRP